MQPRWLFTFLNRSGLSPHWLGVHEVVMKGAVTADLDEIAWYGWLTEPELRSALLKWRFTPDSHEAFSADCLLADSTDLDYPQR
ncbi:hypothetical protein [Streptomyces sp. NPDC002516]